MSYYTANVKLYENSSGAIGTAGTVLAFNANDVVPDATVTANGLLTGGLVTLQTGGGTPTPTFPVTVVGTPGSGQIPAWNTTTHQWEPGASPPGTYAALPTATDAVQFVSLSAKASDANDGLSWGTAKATVAGALTALGGNPGRVICSVGTHSVQGATFCSQQVIEGFGPELTVLKLPNGANTDVLVSNGFAGLTNTGGTGGVAKAQIRSLTIDGNNTNQTIASTTTPGTGTQALPAATINVGSTTGFPASGTFTVRSSSGMQTITYTGVTSGSFTGCTGGVGSIGASEPIFYLGYGIRAYWYDFTIDNVQVRNCVADGIWCEWGTGNGGTSATGAMESLATRWKAYSNGRNGMTFLGPHDSIISNYHLFANGQAGFLGGDSSYHSFGHTWGSPQKFGYDLYRPTRAVECTAEVNNVSGARGVRFGGTTQMKGSKWDGWVYVPPGSLYGGIGFEFSLTASAVDVNATVQDCTMGAFLFPNGNSGSNHRIKALVSQSTGPVFTGAATLVTSGSNGVDVSTFAGAGTLNALSTTGFPASGSVLVSTSNGPQVVTYTALGGGGFTGCTSTGSGIMLTGYTISSITYTNSQVHNDLTGVPTGEFDVTVTGGTTANGKTPQDDGLLTGHGIRDGIETVSRVFGLVNSGGLTTGRVDYTYFTARKSRTVTSIKTRCRGTAAAGLTTAKVGLFSVAPNGDLTLLAASANDTAMWASTFTAYTKTIASQSVVAGQRYAVGILAIGTTMPALYCWATGGLAGESDIQPRPTASLTAQTDLVSTADTTLSVGNANAFYAVLA